MNEELNITNEWDKVFHKYHHVCGRGRSFPHPHHKHMIKECFCRESNRFHKSAIRRKFCREQNVYQHILSKPRAWKNFSTETATAKNHNFLVSPILFQYQDEMFLLLPQHVLHISEKKIFIDTSDKITAVRNRIEIVVS